MSFLSQLFLTIFLSLLLFSSVLLVNAEEEKKEEDPDAEEMELMPSQLLQLGNRDFVKALKQYPFLYIKFEDPKCDICVQMKDCWEIIAKKVKIKDFKPQIKVANVDCLKARDVCSLVGVKAYPTLKFFSYGESYDFDGNRVLGDRCPKEFGENWIYSRFDKTVKKKLADQSLEEYMDENEIGRVIKFSPKNVQMIFKNNLPFLAIFSKDLKSKRQEAEDLINDVAEQIGYQIILVSATLEFGLGKIIASDLDIQYKNLPQVVIVVPQNNQIEEYYIMPESGADVTFDAIVNFQKSWATGKAERAFQSEAVPKPRPEDLIFKIVGRSFNDLVINQEEEKDVLVMFYKSEDTNEIKDMDGLFQKVATKISRKNTNIVFGEFDVSMNKHKDVNFVSYPTFRFYKAGNKKNPVEINNIEDEEEVIKQLKSLTNVGWEDILYSTDKEDL